jgi:hypothetical protein
MRHFMNLHLRFRFLLDFQWYKSDEINFRVPCKYRFKLKFGDLGVPGVCSNLAKLDKLS